jgi:hypothetical protein
LQWEQGWAITAFFPCETSIRDLVRKFETDETIRD